MRRTPSRRRRRPPATKPRSPDRRGLVLRRTASRRAASLTRAADLRIPGRRPRGSAPASSGSDRDSGETGAKRLAARPEPMQMQVLDHLAIAGEIEAPAILGFRFGVASEHDRAASERARTSSSDSGSLRIAARNARGLRAIANRRAKDRPYCTSISPAYPGAELPRLARAPAPSRANRAGGAEASSAPCASPTTAARARAASGRASWMSLIARAPCSGAKISRPRLVDANAKPRRSEFRIARDGLAVQLRRADHRVGAAVTGKRAGAQIEVVRVEIRVEPSATAARPRRTASCRRRASRSVHVVDGARDVVLDREYVLELDRAIETLGPDLRIAGGVDQLRRDPHASRRPCARRRPIDSRRPGLDRSLARPRRGREIGTTSSSRSAAIP